MELRRQFSELQEAESTQRFPLLGHMLACVTMQTKPLAILTGGRRDFDPLLVRLGVGGSHSLTSGCWSKVNLPYALSPAERGWGSAGWYSWWPTQKIYPPHPPSPAIPQQRGSHSPPPHKQMINRGPTQPAPARVPKTTCLTPSPQPALTHQSPGDGTGSTGTPTCPRNPPSCCLECWRLSEPGPGAGAGVGLGDYPQSLCQQLLSHCPAVDMDAGSSAWPEPSHQLGMNGRVALGTYPQLSCGRAGAYFGEHGGDQEQEGRSLECQGESPPLLSQMPPAHSQAPGKAGMC